MRNVNSKMVWLASIALLIAIAAGLLYALSPGVRDDVQWQLADNKGTAAGYASYLEAWPQGAHAPEAKSRNAALLKDERIYTAALKTGNEDSLEQFLAEYPGHVKQDEARKVLQDIKEGDDIVDLLSARKIEVKTEGSGIQSVSVSIRRLVSYPLTVLIPAGTFFVSSSSSVQNMVTTAESRVVLGAVEWVNVSLDAACANRPRDIPGEENRFTVQRSPSQKELAKLMPVLERANVAYALRQAAVWIVTDNADYDDLGILVSRSEYQVFGGTREINEYETAAALQILDRAGIDVKKKRIWKNKAAILKGLTDVELKKWLESR
jgi:hypothetical protein